MAELDHTAGEVVATIARLPVPAGCLAYRIGQGSPLLDLTEGPLAAHRGEHAR